MRRNIDHDAWLFHRCTQCWFLYLHHDLNITIEKEKIMRLYYPFIALCSVFLSGCFGLFLRPTSEPVAVDDAVPPPGYNPMFITGTTPYTGLEKTRHLASDRVLLIDTARVQVMVQYVDEKGRSLTGAGTGESFGRWCFVSDSVDGKVTVLRADQVEASEQNDSLPVALSIVLDHSGSMGAARALLLQSSINKLISEKQAGDGVAVTRFDDDVATERELGNGRDRIAENGLIGFGGSTAIWDGIEHGLAELNNPIVVRAFPRRAVVLFTDGSDNSSTTTMDELIPAARAAGVQIFTVAFGININDNNEKRLKRIATLTGGKYYKIYRREEFTPLFRDIYRRYRNYYQFSLTLATRGIHTITVRICDKRDSLQTQVVIDNRPTEKELAILMPAYTPPSIIQQQPVALIPEPASPPAVLVLEDVLFKKASAEWLPGAPEKLDVIADYMHSDPDLHATIEGHTSNTMGTPHLVLMDLSQRRAQAVVEYLISSGIAAARFAAIGYGPDRPIASQSPESVAARNRRVEVRFGK